MGEKNKKVMAIGHLKESDRLKTFRSSPNLFVMSPSRRIDSRHDQFEGENFMVGPLRERHVKKLMEEKENAK